MIAGHRRSHATTLPPHGFCVGFACCMVMADDRIVLGRLTEQSFPDIWYGAEY